MLWVSLGCTGRLDIAALDPDKKCNAPNLRAGLKVQLPGVERSERSEHVCNFCTLQKSGSLELSVAASASARTREIT